MTNKWFCISLAVRHCLLFCKVVLGKTGNLVDGIFSLSLPYVSPSPSSLSIFISCFHSKTHIKLMSFTLLCHIKRGKTVKTVIYFSDWLNLQTSVPNACLCPGVVTLPIPWRQSSCLNIHLGGNNRHALIFLIWDKIVIKDSLLKSWKSKTCLI